MAALTVPRKKLKVDAFLEQDGEKVPIKMVRHGAAKNYILRLHREGYIQLTLPRYGNKREAWAFAASNREWILRQWSKNKKTQDEKVKSNHQPTIHYRGKLETVCLITMEGQSHASFADQCFPVDLRRQPLRHWLETWLRFRAEEELAQRTEALAGRHGFEYGRVTVRNQRTRWGSCSSRKTISLNWRLIQIPPSHCDYIILHELNHLRHMNHSMQFWRSLEAICPWMRESEAWLRNNANLLQD